MQLLAATGGYWRLLVATGGYWQLLVAAAKAVALQVSRFMIQPLSYYSFVKHVMLTNIT